jgi:hypothetical protein
MNIYLNSKQHYFLHDKWRIYEVNGCNTFLRLESLLQHISKFKLEKGEVNITTLWEDDIEHVLTFDENKDIKSQHPEYFI